MQNLLNQTDGRALATAMGAMRDALDEKGHESVPCMTKDPEQWHPPNSLANNQAHARRLCAGCPVLQECLQYALAVEGDLAPWLRNGIWAGTTPIMRARMSRRQAVRTTLRQNTLQHLTRSGVHRVSA